jgi:HTH-type transcriptional regulator, glycine betaine synthesis regulator
MSQRETTFEPWESAVIDMFVSAGDTLGVPRSVSIIYGLLYCSQEPLSSDEVIEKLRISKGSASQGLRYLTNLGAVKKQHVVGDRKIYYAPERSLRQLSQGFLDGKLLPGIKRGNERLEQIAETLSENDEHARKSVERLVKWCDKMQKLIPTITFFLK